jgi:hypothetical protein
MVKTISYPFIMFMKVGFHANEILEQIIDRKLKEEQDCGRIFWGYNGTTCHPSTVKTFVKQALQKGQIPKLIMTFTPSKPFSTNIKWAKEFTIDSEKWLPLPGGIHVKGSKHAIVCNNLQQVNEGIDFNAYEVATGNRKGVKLSNYIRYRIDKACAVYTNTTNLLSIKQQLTRISYIAELKEPYAVFLR